MHVVFMRTAGEGVVLYLNMAPNLTSVSLTIVTFFPAFSCISILFRLTILYQGKAE